MSYFRNQARLEIAVGRLMLNWAMIQVSVEMANDTIARELQRYGQPSEKVPDRFNEQLAFLSRLAETHCDCKETLVTARKVFGTLGRLKSIRDNLAHAIMIHTSMGDEDPSFRFHDADRKFEPPKRPPKTQRELEEHLYGKAIKLSKLESDVAGLTGYPGLVTLIRGRTCRSIRERAGD